ncbi:uncharacterized protein LOC131847381 [Achroia grisella]|uniref:uncharacterized protein LOC131847381 n=1 Tax=Achroia grisella TaxID=688607 RepID=UPI0027D27AB0|nr:uncharacterized protein LOC131847381 [Achroia grisella]
MNQSKQKTCEKKLKIAEQRVIKIINKIESLKLNSSYISQLDFHGKVSGYKFKIGETKCHIVFSVAVVIISLLIARWLYGEITTKSCLLELPYNSKSLFRPPEDCSMCIGVDHVVRVSNITAQEFEELYAYGATPVIVTDATGNWKAIEDFTFQFFANFYRVGKMGKQINDCFYFAYKSGLNSLQDVFDMEESRANLSGDPWYVGWSTCYDEETRQLRTFYNRPYFLPTTAESDMVDWVFMGGPGQGAHMHIILRSIMLFAVVVDTNRWYHKTNVLPGDISITIGAEYD